VGDFAQKEIVYAYPPVGNGSEK